jgi:hypothetical protein
MEEVLQIVRNILNRDYFFSKFSPLQVEDVTELWDICLTSTYFQFENKFYQQKEGMAMGNLPSPVVSNIFMEHSEETALDTADHKPAKSLRYVDDTFVVWPHGPARSQQFLHLNNLRTTIKFTMEIEANGTLPFLDVLIMKRGHNHHSWSRALLEKPPIVQLLENFPAFYGTRRFITTFT